MHHFSILGLAKGSRTVHASITVNVTRSIYEVHHVSTMVLAICRCRYLSVLRSATMLQCFVGFAVRHKPGNTRDKIAGALEKNRGLTTRLAPTEIYVFHLLV